MPNFTQGSTRVVLQQSDLAVQNNGSIVLDSRRTRPLWFDGRFLSARDLEREQDYFLQRQADLGQAGGFGVMHGLFVDQPPSTGQVSDAETIVIHAGNGITPAGELVMIPNDLTIQLSDLADEENLGLQFGISTMPRQPARTRTGLYVIALRPVEFTANPITSYPTSIQGSRTTHDGDIVEATAVSLVPYPNPVNSSDPTMQQAMLARQIFIAGNPGTLSDSLLPLAMVSIQRGVISWIDPYLVRRDSGPQYSGVRFGLSDPAAQQAQLLQYNSQLLSVVATRQSNGLAANFAATDYFQALPSAGPFPLDAINTNDFSQTFFPPQMDVRLSIIPTDELAALVEDSQSLPPIDLTLPAASYANLAVFALIPVQRNLLASLKSSLPDTPLNPTLPQVIANRSPLQLLRLFQGSVGVTRTPLVANGAWATAIGSQKYGFYVRRRSEAVYVDFTSVGLSSSQNPLAFGSAVTFTATVRPSDATGTIQFNDGVTPLGPPVALNNATATLSVPSGAIGAFSVGAHPITAVYSGDGTNAGSTSATLNEIVSDSSVALASSQNPSVLGQSIVFTATVSPNTATGNVQFKDGATALGSPVSLSGASASLSISALTVGSHAITAEYSGDAGNAGSSSTALTQTITPAPSTVTLAASLNPATVGQGVSFTATVKGSVTGVAPTGSVQFKDLASAIGTVPVTNGVAVLSTSTLPVGAHSIAAVYSGDANYLSSTSAVVAETISPITSGVVVSSSPNPSIFNQPVTLTATVTPGTASWNDSVHGRKRGTWSGRHARRRQSAIHVVQPRRRFALDYGGLQWRRDRRKGDIGPGGSSRESTARDGGSLGDAKPVDLRANRDSDRDRCPERRHRQHAVHGRDHQSWFCRRSQRGGRAQGLHLNGRLARAHGSIRRGHERCARYLERRATGRESRRHYRGGHVFTDAIDARPVRQVYCDSHAGLGDGTSHVHGWNKSIRHSEPQWRKRCNYRFRIVVGLSHDHGRVCGGWEQCTGNFTGDHAAGDPGNFRRRANLITRPLPIRSIRYVLCLGNTVNRHRQYSIQRRISQPGIGRNAYRRKGAVARQQPGCGSSPDHGSLQRRSGKRGKHLEHGDADHYAGDVQRGRDIVVAVFHVRTSRDLHGHCIARLRHGHRSVQRRNRSYWIRNHRGREGHGSVFHADGGHALHHSGLCGRRKLHHEHVCRDYPDDHEGTDDNHGYVVRESLGPREAGVFYSGCSP